MTCYIARSRYEQLRTVSERPNPPKEGRYWVANDRAEGYADYKVGLYYLSCDQVQVTTHSSVAEVAEEEVVDTRTALRTSSGRTPTARPSSKATAGYAGVAKEVESAAMVEIGAGRSKQIPLDHEQRKDLARDAQQRRLRRVD